jgi:hypothetical protein
MLKEQKMVSPEIQEDFESLLHKVSKQKEEIECITTKLDQAKSVLFDVETDLKKEIAKMQEYDLLKIDYARINFQRKIASRF